MDGTCGHEDEGIAMVQGRVHDMKLLVSPLSDIPMSRGESLKVRRPAKVLTAIVLFWDNRCRSYVGAEVGEEAVAVLFKLNATAFECRYLVLDGL